MTTEINELFTEELTLLKKIQKYGKEHSQGKLGRIEKVKLLLLYRIYSNLYSSLLLTSHEEIEATIPDTLEEDSSHTILFEDAYIESKYWGFVKIKEITYEYTNETRRSVMDIDAKDFIEAILKDVESGVIEYVEKGFHDKLSMRYAVLTI